MNIPVEHGLIVAAIIFLTGLTGTMIRRNLVFMLLSIEIMLNAAGFAFVLAGAKWLQADGQVMFIFILTMAAAEVSIGLALILRLYHNMKNIDSDKADQLKD
jgi:NADH-quinone oxidoreductase subunit K